MSTTTTTDSGTESFGNTGRKIAVHKKDHEGILEIDAMTGQVLPGQHDRPEWAEGLFIAQLTERHSYYLSRLGTSYPEEMKNPDLMAYEDLAWLGSDTKATDEETGEDGKPFAIEADAEHRLDTVARILGIERDADKVEASDNAGFELDSVVEVEIMADNTRTEAEQKAFIEAQEAGFKEATGT